MMLGQVAPVQGLAPASVQALAFVLRVRKSITYARPERLALLVLQMPQVLAAATPMQGHQA